jgi:hypothetical protein
MVSCLLGIPQLLPIPASLPEILMLPMASSRSLLTIVPVFRRGDFPARWTKQRQDSE